MNYLPSSLGDLMQLYDQRVINAAECSEQLEKIVFGGQSSLRDQHDLYIAFKEQQITPREYCEGLYWLSQDKKFNLQIRALELETELKRRYNSQMGWFVETVCAYLKREYPDLEELCQQFDQAQQVFEDVYQRLDLSELSVA